MSANCLGTPYRGYALNPIGDGTVRLPSTSFPQCKLLALPIPYRSQLLSVLLLTNKTMSSTTYITQLFTLYVTHTH